MLDEKTYQGEVPVETSEVQGCKGVFTLRMLVQPLLQIEALFQQVFLLVLRINCCTIGNHRLGYTLEVFTIKYEVNQDLTSPILTFIRCQVKWSKATRVKYLCHIKLFYRLLQVSF